MLRGPAMASQLPKAVRSLFNLPFLFKQARALSNVPVLYHSFQIEWNVIRQLATRPPVRPDYSNPVDSNQGRTVDSDSDSDSDDDVRKNYSFNSSRGESEFWRKKMRTLHSILDVNKDGVISFDDFLLLSERFKSMAHVSQLHFAEFNALMKEVWEAQYGPVDPYNLITTQQFLEEMHHSLNDKCLRKKIHRFLPYLFKAVDKDKSGEITVEEFKLFFKCLGLQDEDAVVSFNAIDINNDGRITIREFVSLGKDFFLTEDEQKISKWFWGPLIQH